MELIRNRNSWSCIISAAAMVLDKHPDVIEECIGHDGSEIIFPEMRDPARRRGFHVQEIIDCAHVYGYAVTPIEALPISTPDMVHMYEVKFRKARFKCYLRSNIGIVTGRTRLWGHAVAWDRQRAFDPRTGPMALDECRMEIDTFWLFSKIISK